MYAEEKKSWNYVEKTNYSKKNTVVLFYIYIQKYRLYIGELEHNTFYKKKCRALGTDHFHNRGREGLAFFLQGIFFSLFSFNCNLSKMF